jgi:aminoglycoside 3-N-acetyltransferase
VGGNFKAEAVTSDSLTRDLRALGIRRGQVVLVHVSMRAIGEIPMGPQTVVLALRRALGRSGTLVVPTQTADNSDTSRIYKARVAGMNANEIARYHAAMPPFNSLMTPSTSMGLIAEQVRLTAGAVRSNHPQTSFAALGPMAQRLMADHAPDCHLGGSSPMARLYAIGASILLIGIGYDACSAFHLAEYRYVPDPPTRTYRCVVEHNGRRLWWEYEDVMLDDSDFIEIGAELDRKRGAVHGRVGNAESRLLLLTSAVDFAAEWMRTHRRMDAQQC